MAKIFVQAVPHDLVIFEDCDIHREVISQSKNRHPTKSCSKQHDYNSRQWNEGVSGVDAPDAGVTQEDANWYRQEATNIEDP